MQQMFQPSATIQACKHTFSALTNLKRLQNLQINSNELELVDDEAFRANNNLEYLRLGHNRLTTFPSALWALTGLKTLDLTNNLIVSLSTEQGKEHRLEKLTHLYLRYNPIQEIPKSFLAHFPALEHVDLRQSRLFQLNSASLTAFPGQLKLQEPTAAGIDRPRNFPASGFSNLQNDTAQQMTDH